MFFARFLPFEALYKGELFYSVPVRVMISFIDKVVPSIQS
jgi:hypothetical protein